MAGEAQHQRLHRRRRQVHWAHRPRDQAATRRRIRDLDVRKPIAEPGDQLHPLLRRLHLQQARRRAFQRRYQNIARFAVAQPHPPQMLGEMPFREEVGHHRFLQRRRMPVRQPPRGKHAIQQRRRQHRVTKPQPGKQHLGEGADIDHAPRIIHALQRSQGPPGIAELAVVIVLQHEGAGAARPGQQLQPPRHGKHHARRVLG